MLFRNHLRNILTIAFLAFVLVLGCDTGSSSDEGNNNNTSGDIPEAKSNAQRIQPNLTDQEMKDFTGDNNEFASELFDALVHDSEFSGKNIVVSPYSVSVDLAMVWAGAEGDTETEMADVLHFGDEQKVHEGFDALEMRYSQASDGLTITSANSVWAQDGWNFLQSFLDTLAQYYGAGIKLVDFNADPESARQLINKWVEDKTNGYIKELFPPNSISSQTVMALVNAIYFEAEWAETFDGSDTYEGTFSTPSGDVLVYYMHDTREVDYYEGSDFQAVSLPYKGGEYSMILVLPDSADDTHPVLSDIAGVVEESVAGFDATTVSLAIPRFEYGFGLLMNDTFKDLGMVKAFSGDADFSGMDGARDLFLSKVIHKAFIKVYEKGTIAAAATGSAVDFGTSGVWAVSFVHPFVYAILDNTTGQILFVGRVVDPTDKGDAN